jgi:hypothetical protein
VLGLNFAPNALFTYPTPIREHTPGFVWLLRSKDALASVCVLALLAVGLRDRVVTRAWGAGPDRLLTVLWVAGLLMFSMALRGLYLWWLLALPLTGAALASIPAPSVSLVGRTTVALAAASPALLALAAVPDARRAAPFEGDVHRRVVALPLVRSALALADSLERLAPGRAGHVMTTFRYGNALLWRLPRYSVSIDGRTIFPDSAALIEGYVAGQRRAPLPMPIASSDVAIVAVGSRMDDSLSRSPGWRQVAAARARVDSGVVDSAVLWVREAWLTRAHQGDHGDRGRVLP